MNAAESAFAEGLSRGSMLALEQLADEVAARIRTVADPSSEGPTWLGLQQMLDQRIAAARDFTGQP